jgi:hypothetical protein
MGLIVLGAAVWTTLGIAFGHATGYIKFMFTGIAFKRIYRHVKRLQEGLIYLYLAFQPKQN